MSDLGISFKTKRESLGLTLEQIASETRIGTRFLNAIEKEDFQILPGGIFSRGFIKTYAERLGMDPEQAVAEFDRRVNYKEAPPIDTLGVSAPPPERSNRLLYPVLIAGLLILVTVGYLAVRQFNKPATASEPAPQPQPPVAAAPAPPEVIPAAAPVETPVASAETQPPPQQQPPAPAVDTTSSTAAAAPPPPAPVPTPAPTPAPAPLTPPAPTPALETNDALTLVVAATEVTWVKILGDKYVLLNETIQPGTTRRFTAKRSIGIITGNAGGLSLKLNDRDMAPLGKSGQIRIVTITPENLKKFIP